MRCRGYGTAPTGAPLKMTPITLQSVLHCPALPSLPTVALEVLELTRDANVNLSRLATTIQNDMALSAKVLRTVNSTYYGLQKPCPTIQRAITYLGLNTVKALVLGFSLVEIVGRGNPLFDYSDFWRRSLTCAAAARRLATAHRRCDAEEAFTCSLLQDIGMLAILAAAPERYAEVIAAIEGDHRRLPAQERSSFGFDHTEVGEQLGARWRLPAQFLLAIRSHHATDIPETNEAAPLCRTAAFCCELSSVLHLAEPWQALASSSRRLADWFGLSGEDLRAVIGALREDARQLARFFEVDAGAGPSTSEILAAAEEVAIQHYVAVDREHASLLRNNLELTRQVTTDPLTGVGNRRHFDEQITTRFDQAIAFSGSLGLLLIDADHFKSLNDEHGHQVGDAVLTSIAQRLQRGVRDRDLVCRYGGEEFAVIVPGASVSEITTVAERLRRSISETPFESAKPDGSPLSLNLTVSIGVTVLGPESFSVLSTSDLLVSTADKALYAAKQGGRNCVRLFRARTQAAPAVA